MEGGEALAAGKDRLRERMRGRIRSGGADSGRVVAAFRGWLERRPEVRVVAVYWPLAGEPDLGPVVMADSSREWVYPRVEGDDLVFHRVVDPAVELVPGAFRIREPMWASEVVGPERIDAWICPGLAFDAAGGRLGRGKGFYDRALLRARPDAWRIGVCFPEQLVESVPCGPRDVRMQMVWS